MLYLNKRVLYFNQYADVFVFGYRKSSKDYGWLLGFEDERYAGVMELGVPVKEKPQVYLAPTVSESDDFAYIYPIKCRVKFRNYKGGSVTAA